MAEEVEKKLMRLKKDELVEEARKRCLEETGTKSDLVQYLKPSLSNDIKFTFQIQKFSL